MVIEANASSLQNFLKDSGSTAPVVAGAAPVAAANPLQPINEGVQNTTDSLDKFTNLLEAVNKLLSQPIVKGVMEKGVERKSGVAPQAAPPQEQPKEPEAPPGYNPVSSNDGFSEGGLPPPQKPPQEEVKKISPEKAPLFYEALLKSVEVMQEQDPERTIKEIYDELKQPMVKDELVKQIEVLIKDE